MADPTSNLKSHDLVDRLRFIEKYLERTGATAEEIVFSVTIDEAIAALSGDSSAPETSTPHRCDWPREIEAILDGLGERAVRVREGGGPENLAMSLAVTIAKLARSPDSEDAAKWRALRNCARITAMGSAGMDRPNDPDAHLTLNFWTHNDRETEDYPRRWLDTFVKKALGLQGSAVETKPSAPTMAGESISHWWKCPNCRSRNDPVTYHTSCPHCGTVKPSEKASGDGK